MPNTGFDPTTLDWSRHLLSRDEAELGDGVFLADVAAMLGTATFEGWWGDEPAHIRPAVHADVTIVDPEEAFEADGSPVTAIHQTFGPAVRAVLSPAAWRDLDLRVRDEIAWRRTLSTDPAGGPPLSTEALTARAGSDADDPITEGNWQAAWEMVEADRAMREAAIQRVTAIARGLAELVLAGRIRLVARPLAGGPTDVVVPTTIWSGGAETRLRRLAACGFDPLAPHDAMAPATYLIFAHGDGLEEAIAEHGAANLVCMTPPHEPWSTVWVDDGSDALSGDQDHATETGISEHSGLADGPQIPMRRSRTLDLDVRVEAFLLAMMKEHDNGYWRLKDLRALAAARFGNNMDGIVGRVRNRLVTVHGFDHLTKAGQPVTGDRPSTISQAALRRLIESTPEVNAAATR